MRHVTDKGFESEDTNLSGYLEAAEMTLLLDKVAQSMNVGAPSNDEVMEILGAPDEDNDGTLSKDEFLNLIMHGFSNILVLEEDLQQKMSDQNQEAYKQYVKQQ